MDWFKKLVRKTPPAHPAPATLHRGADGVYVLRIFGVLRKSTVDRIQAVGAQDFDRGVSDLKLLIVLTDFQGWSRGDRWDDLDFFSQYEHKVTKIAVVGEPSWKEDTLLFLAAGHRKGEVRYFLPDSESEASAWLIA